MTRCVSENEVVDLFEGRLDAEATEALTRHIDGCAACRTLLADTAQITEIAGGDDADERPLERGAYVGPPSVLIEGVELVS